MIDSSGIGTRKRGHNSTTRLAFHTSAASPNNLHVPTRTRLNASHAGPMMPMQTPKLLLLTLHLHHLGKSRKTFQTRPLLAYLSLLLPCLGQDCWAPISDPRSNPSPDATQSHQFRHHLHQSMRLSVSMTQGVNIKITQAIVET